MTKGAFSQSQRRQAQLLQRQHAASQERDQRLGLALEMQSEAKQGQRIWIIPEFDAGNAEARYIIEAVRKALPEYDCQMAHAPGVEEEDIYQLMAENSSDGDRHE